jgi:branched-chain amino acid transport system permease protein
VPVRDRAIGAFILWPGIEGHPRGRNRGRSHGHQRLLAQDAGLYGFSAFFEGIAGGLMAHLITTISPTLFTFILTFNLLIIIVVGGLGSTTGVAVMAVLFTFGGEWLRVVEEPMTLFGYDIPGIPGMRMVFFSLILVAVMLFARQGILGRNEFSWRWLVAFTSRKGRPS